MFVEFSVVRAPIKTCPSLYLLFQDAEATLLSAFLNRKAFEKLEWLSDYRFEADDCDAVNAASRMLQQEKKERLNPLETEAARIVTIAKPRGYFALEGVARTKLERDRISTLTGQRDELARSLWAYVNEYSLFEAAENSLHLRLYRRFDKHYQTFMAAPSPENRLYPGNVLQALLADLGQRLDRGDGYAIERFDIPEDDDEPAAEMYLLFHPNPPTSVREIDEAGNRSRIYFRPPGEAMVVYTPSTGRVHVRADTRQLRHTIAEGFIETVLDQPLSHQPVDFQAYDISKFFSGFDLPLPDFHDVVVLRAQVIRAEVSIGNLANRLSLATTISQDLGTIIDTQPGLERVFSRAVAIRFIEIAVRYRRAGRDDDETLDFTLSDRNTSSLLSLDDPFERVLGHRLLRHWGILSEGRSPTDAESQAAIPALLELWDIGAEKVTGGWLHARRIDPAPLIDLGFLVLAGWEDDDLIDDEEEVGLVAAQIVARPDGLDVRPSLGQEAPGGSPDLYRSYRVRKGWVAQHLPRQIAGVLDTPATKEVGPDILDLGTLEVDGRTVPVYLVRRLDDERARAAIDTELRGRSDRGTGLVMQAGQVAGTCFAANVLTPIVDHIDRDSSEISLSAESLKAVYRRDRSLARGGQTVAFIRSGENSGTLSVPGRGTIHIPGANRVLVIERLVEAHNAGTTPILTADLKKGFEDQSLANIFNQPLWNKLKAGFIRSAGHGKWEVAI